jgi:hypothetical protein
MLLGWSLTTTSHPLGADHSYQLAVLVTTYPVVAVPDGENSLTVTAHVLPLTLDTGAVYVTAQVLQLKLLTHVELVKYHASLVKSLTLVGNAELVIYPFGFVELYGVYPKAVVTSPLFIHVIYQESLVKSDTFVGIVGKAHQSFIFFPVVPSNTAKCQSVELLGHTTSPLPHHHAHHWKVSASTYLGTYHA